MRGFFVCSLLAFFSYTVAIPATCPQGPYAPVEGDCSKFKQCVHGTYVVMPCPSTLVWNQELSKCDWPIAGDDCLENVANPANCPQGPYAPVEGDCSKFKQCVHGSYTVMPCAPGGTVWRQDLSRCDWPIAGDDCLENGPECSEGDTEPMEGDCTRYKVCNHGAYTAMACALGTVWYQDKDKCDWPSEVDSCGEYDQGSPDDACGAETKMIPWANCRGFDWCLNGNRKLMGENGTCAAGTRFSRSLQVCVWKGDSYDDCVPTGSDQPDDEPTNTPGNAPDMTIEEYCEQEENRDKVLPHPTECQLYIDCSDPEPKNLGYMRLPYIKGCTYPQLFNVATGKCDDDFQNVECGERHEEKFICKYYIYAYGCRSIHCRPCSVDAGDCRGLPDGDNEMKARLDSPYYVKCQGERWVPQEMYSCASVDGYWQLFDKETKQCVDPRTL